MKSPWIDDVSQAKKPLAFILLASRPYLTHAICALISITIAGVFGSLQPLIYKHIVDAIGHLLSGGTYQTLCIWVGAYLVSLAGSMLFWRIGNRISAYWVMGVRATGRYGLTTYLLKHSHSYFENRFAGSTANKIAHAADGSKNLVQELIFGIAPFGVAVVMTMVLALSASLYIGLLFLLWLLIAVPLNYYFAKQRTTYTVRAQESETKLRGSAVDLVSNIRAVQEYARASHELSRMQQLIVLRRDFGLQNWMYGQYVSIVNSVLQVVFVALMIGIAIFESYKGLITPGTIVLVLALATSIGERLFWLSNEIANIAENWGEIREGLEDLLNEHDVPDAPDAKALVVSEGKIVFTDVAFSYHAGESVLRNFNLTILPGEKIGLVGKSGAGKSTLVKLLLRHYDLSGGSITIDGQSIAGVKQDTLRDAISIVPQEPLLFHRSIRENIGYGKEGATLDEIHEAATLAQAHDFIKKLPDAYDTLVGERGVKLSGGQRQRVAIARALLKPAKILLLDEATSALDSESEGEIQKGLESLMEGKTVIAIAHRLSTLRAMDRILVLDQGVIVEDGSHESLVRKKNGVYSSLWKHQSGGYLGDE